MLQPFQFLCHRIEMVGEGTDFIPGKGDRFPAEITAGNSLG